MAGSAVPSVAVSAPGKVLLAGGYLVVDRAYTGLAFGLSARIHVLAQPIPVPEGVSLSEIIVRSPQFQFAEWRYGYRLADSRGVAVVQLKGLSTSDQTRNKFVETALQYALTYVSAYDYALIKPTTLTILADSDYYSHADTATQNESHPASRFVNFNVALSDAHKTGLGSSAALVSSFIGAVLGYLLPPSILDVRSAIGRKRVHNLAQAAHCQAQGKIGSGFDVAAAVHGSCEYRRFSPGVLEKIGEPSLPGFSEKLKALVNDEAGDLWDTEIREKSVVIPKGLKLLMCDVDCGSETPGMVKQVFAWRKAHAEDASRIWNALQAQNERLAKALKITDQRGLEETGLMELKQCILACRQLIREMSEKSGVPIEPAVQTELLDTCTSVPGVVGGVVPGAGGYDALALIIEDRLSVQQELEKVLKLYKSKALSEQPQIGNVKLLSVTQSPDGIRTEDSSLYQGWT